jgi:uncharacterized protein (UPF0297 family)
MSSNTKSFNVDDVNDALIEKTINDVYDALTEIGYNPINQIVGYLMSGDPGYISSHKESRKKITLIDRTKIIEVLVRKFINK